MQDQLLNLSNQVSTLARSKVTEIQTVMRTAKILALNALIEANRAGEAGRGFAVVAQEVGEISRKITDIAAELNQRMAERIASLNSLGEKLILDQHTARATDLALNMIEIIDRNLYERSCDVRWWATDSAIVTAAESRQETDCRWADHRLAIILGSYTVYLDLWVLDLDGRVIASGRADRYPKVRGLDGRPAQNFRDAQWFRDALATRDGTEFAVADIYRESALNDAMVATYATAIRADGATDGRPVGVLAIFFDWETQAQAVVHGVRLTDQEKGRTRCLILDANQRIIADSAGRGLLTSHYPLRRHDQQGAYVENGSTVVGYALTPGYESYDGLGWYGVIEQSDVTIS